MNGSRETDHGGGERHLQREIVEALTAMVVSAEAYRRWASSGPDAKAQTVEALTSILKDCHRTRSAVEALLARSQPD